MDIENLLKIHNISFDSEGKTPRAFRKAASLHSATAHDLAFCSASAMSAPSQIVKSNAGMVFCSKTLRGKVRPRDPKQTLYFLDNPRLAFIKVITHLQDVVKPAGISLRAIIDKSVNIGKNCYIGDYVVIGSNCSIGSGTIIHDRVSLVQNCIVGSNCIIQSGCSIGSDGFGFERDESGRLIRFPHSGYVRIGDDVEISANCSIARGSLSDTVIKNGTKLDALVHVAHNVIIGRDCELTAGTVVGGSTTIGDSCWMGLNSTIKNKLQIGHNVIVASGASVIRNVPDGDIVAGVPAKSIKDKVTTNELFLMAGQKPKASDTTVA
jgi:UDP-3-O-[3-hydroxymyristoyl] glucosamine N-acyltransferase